MADERDRQLTHPIQVVARRTGLSADLIRAWERRYAAVVPERSATNRRLYSEADIARLRLLRLATLGGRRIGDVAGLSLEELRKLVASDEAAAEQAPPEPSWSGADDLLRATLEAVEEMDTARTEILLGRAGVELGASALVEELLLPLMTRLGELWRDGRLRVAHEHLASAVVRSFLGTLKDARRVQDPAPEIVVTTPAGQLHELGALAAAVSAAVEGWRVCYLGPNLPAEEIAAAARKLRSRAVALSITYPADDPRLVHELRSLRRQLDDDVAVIVGGSAAAAYREALEGLDLLFLAGLPPLREELQRLREAALAPRT